MSQVRINELGKITDLLQGTLNDMYGLDPQPTVDALDTLSRGVIVCEEILTRIKRLRRWVQMAREDDVPLGELPEEREATELERPKQLWADLTEGVEIPF